MEDLKRLFRKGSFLLILLCLAVAAGSFFTGFKEDKGRKQPEESWEMAMEISGSAATGNTGAGDNGKEPQESLSSPYFLEEPDSLVTIFDVNLDGLIGAYTFIHRKGNLQTFYVQIGWREGGVPKIISTAVSDLAEIKLTEKGYFIYAYTVQLYHSSLRQFWRAAPLSDRCRELTEKYLDGLSYVNYNVLVTDWDRSNVEDILMPCMFEDLYRMDTGEILRSKNGEIPAEVYERIMTTYFPVTKERIREICGYRADTDSYPYEMIFSSPYPPFGEVAGDKENPDGTLTLFVDGVWPDYNSDCAFTNIITVQPFDDGTFRYLSNSIEKKELDIPNVYDMK